MEKGCQTNRKAQINTSFCQVFFPEESDKILCRFYDIKINGSKGRIRRKHRFERILKQIQKMLGATCRKKLMAALNKRSAEKKKQQHA